MKGQEMDFAKPILIILMVEPFTWQAIEWLLIGAFVVWFAQFLLNRYLRKPFRGIFQAFEKLIKKDQENTPKKQDEKT